MSTKNIEATVLRNNLSDAIKAVTSGDTLVLNKRGKPQAVILNIEDYEDYLAAQDPEYIKGIAEARKNKKWYTPEEVFGELWNQ